MSLWLLSLAAPVGLLNLKVPPVLFQEINIMSSLVSAPAVLNVMVLLFVFFVALLQLVSGQQQVTYNSVTWAGTGTLTVGNGFRTSASFRDPIDITRDFYGNFYVVEANGAHVIRKIDTSGQVSVFAGTTGTYGSVDGTGTAAQFFNPTKIVIDKAGNLFVSEWSGNRIRKITPSAVVSNLAGDGTAGYLDGIGTNAKFNVPSSLAIDQQDNLYMTESGTHRVRSITPVGVVSTYAGSGTPTWADGYGTSASFANPVGLFFGGSGNLFVIDSGNNRIRLINSTRYVSTFAGSGVASSLDGQGTYATFSSLGMGA